MPHQLAPNPPTVHTLSTVESERLHTLYPDLSNSLAQCKTCRGRKQFLWYDQDGETPVSWECNCEEQFILHRFLLNAGVDWSYQKLSWTDATAVDPAAMELVLDYGHHAEQYVHGGLGLVLHGNHGNGKTLLSILLLKMMLSNGYDCFFVNFQDMCDYFTSGWRNEEQKAWFTQRVRNAGVLVIDDIGTEYMGSRKVENGVVVHRPLEIIGAMVDRVIRSRVAADRPTIITTNFDLDELKRTYQSNVMSLLTESSMTFKFISDDYRPESNQRRLAERRAGLTRPIVLG